MFDTLRSRRRALPTSDHFSRILRADTPPSAFDAWLAFTIGYGVTGYGVEGGEADNPDDPGGFTWRGITLTNFRVWRRNSSASVTQLLQMSEQEIVAFYGCNYWNAVCGDQLPPALALGVADFGVNAGPGTSSKVLQKSVGFTSRDVDGSIGPMTLAAITSAPSLTFLVGRFCTLRSGWYAALNEPEFAQGWANRANACEVAMTALLPTPPATTGVST